MMQSHLELTVKKLCNNFWVGFSTTCFMCMSVFSLPIYCTICILLSWIFLHFNSTKKTKEKTHNVELFFAFCLPIFTLSSNKKTIAETFLFALVCALPTSWSFFAIPFVYFLRSTMLWKNFENWYKKKRTRLMLRCSTMRCNTEDAAQPDKQ